jgi:hypothetical protein
VNEREIKLASLGAQNYAGSDRNRILDFCSDGGEEFGAVREVSPNGRPELVIYVENAGEFVVPLSAVEAVHSQKVILNCAKLERRLRRAIGHAHDAEEPDA